MKTLYINGQEIEADEFAWDGCHKIYVITDQESRDKLEGYGYNFFPVEELREIWDVSCGLKFISSGDLSEQFVLQFFEEEIGPVRITVSA